MYCKGTARIKHKMTGTIFEIESDELQWDGSADERQMGPEIRHQAQIAHPELGELTWSLWEYPEGVENFRESKVNGHEIIEDFDYGLHASEE